MEQVIRALKLAKECTYADEMMESAKEYLRKEIDEALKLVLPQANVIKSVCECGKPINERYSPFCGRHCWSMK